MPTARDTSQYLNTPIKDWYLDIMVPRTVPASKYDKIVRIPPEFNQRPDLMSFKEYGTPGLWWVFSVRNPDLIQDPIDDFIAGMEIYVPSDMLKI